MQCNLAQCSVVYFIALSLPPLCTQSGQTSVRKMQEKQRSWPQESTRRRLRDLMDTRSVMDSSVSDVEEYELSGVCVSV